MTLVLRVLKFSLQLLSLLAMLCRPFLALLQHGHASLSLLSERYRDENQPQDLQLHATKESEWAKDGKTFRVKCPTARVESEK